MPDTPDTREICRRDSVSLGSSSHSWSPSSWASCEGCHLGLYIPCPSWVLTPFSNQVGLPLREVKSHWLILAFLLTSPSLRVNTHLGGSETPMQTGFWQHQPTCGLDIPGPRGSWNQAPTDLFNVTCSPGTQAVFQVLYDLTPLMAK